MKVKLRFAFENELRTNETTIYTCQQKEIIRQDCMYCVAYVCKRKHKSKIIFALNYFNGK